MKELKILQSKFKIPQPRKNYIVRNHLFDILDEVNDHKITIIKGDAGSGKTTLLSSYIRERNLDNIRWITLDDNCNNVFLFWRYFIESLKEQIGKSGAELVALFDANMQKDNIEQILTVLINQLNFNNDFVIVFDDFQVVKDKLLIKTIEFFLKNIPEYMHFIFITREQPSIYLGTLSMEGQVQIIDERELKCENEVCVSFLKNTLGLNYSDKVFDFICNLAEGWIGGLQLISLALAGKTEEQMLELKFQNRLLDDYITREIFNYLSEKEQKLLLYSSVFSYFNVEMCKKLLGDDYSDVFNDIMDRNLLVICVDEKNGLYRYHGILLEYLRNNFKKEYKKESRSIYLQSSEILYEMGDYEETLNLLFAVDAYEKAMEILVKIPQNALSFSFFSKVPMTEIYKNPDFSIQYFFYYYANFELEICRKIYEVLSDKFDTNDVFKAIKCADLFVNETYGISKISVLTLAEIENLPLNDVTKAFLLIKEAFLKKFQCGTREALDYLDRALAINQKSGNSYIEFFVVFAKTQIYEQLGELNKCMELYENSEYMIEDLKMLELPFYIGKTGVYIKRLETQKAWETIKKAEQAASQDEIIIDTSLQYNVVEYNLLTEPFEKSLSILKEFLNSSIGENIIVVAPLLKYALWNHRDKELEEIFIKEYEQEVNSRNQQDCQLLYAKLIYERGEKDKAICIVDEILKFSRKNRNKIKIIEADLFKMHILFNENQHGRELKNLLFEVISYGTENRIKQPFIFEKEMMLKVPKQYEHELKEKLTDSEMLFLNEIIGKHMIQSNNLLTSREMEVLKEIDNGKSNKEIADELYVSVATIKTHIINIYSKLGVNSRIAAVNVGKTLKLL